MPGAAPVIKAVLEGEKTGWDISGQWEGVESSCKGIVVVLMLTKCKVGFANLSCAQEGDNGSSLRNEKTLELKFKKQDDVGSGADYHGFKWDRGVYVNV